MYIDDIVNKEVLEELVKRIENINIDAVLDSGYIEQLIEDNKWSHFPSNTKYRKTRCSSSSFI